MRTHGAMPRDIERLGRRMSDFLEQVLRGKSALMNVSAGAWRPSIDLYESEDAILVLVDLAGVRRGEIAIELEGERLRIAGRRREPAEARGGDLKKCHQMEIDYGPFERVLLVSVPIDRDQIDARYEEGFLKIRLLKKQRELAHKIEIL
jgi:HSP20 family protein